MFRCCHKGHRVASLYQVLDLEQAHFQNFDTPGFSTTVNRSFYSWMTIKVVKIFLYAQFNAGDTSSHTRTHSARR